jgi:hypothetical protein
MKSWFLALVAFFVGLVAFALLRTVYRRRKTTSAAPFGWAKTFPFVWTEFQPLGQGEVCAKPYRQQSEDKIYHSRHCKWARMISRPIRFVSWQAAERVGYRPCTDCRPDL